MKLAVNLIAAFCDKTPVNPRWFGRVIEVIQGKLELPLSIVMHYGFGCWKRTLTPSNVPSADIHFDWSMRGNRWHVLSSFLVAE